MEFLDLAPDSVMSYKIVSMNVDYILNIIVDIPEKNSYSIYGYNVYFLKKKTKSEIVS